MNVVRRHTTIEELTPTLLREFVEKIVVHERLPLTGTRRGRYADRKSEIYYSFVCKGELPDIPPPPPPHTSRVGQIRKRNFFLLFYFLLIKQQNTQSAAARAGGGGGRVVGGSLFPFFLIIFRKITKNPHERGGRGKERRGGGRGEIVS